MQKAASFRISSGPDKKLDRSELRGTITMNLVYLAAFSMFVALGLLESSLT